MRKKVGHILLIHIFFCIRLFAQYNSEFNFFQNTGNAISVKAEFDVASNNINAEMVNKLFFGGYIDKTIKDKALNNALGYNRAGAYFNYDIHAFFGKNKKYSFFVAAKQQYLVNATYTRDLFYLAFYGNKPLAGSVANLSNSNVNTITFNEFKIGILFKGVDSTAKIGISLSAIQGNRLLYFQTGKNSSLFTSSSYDEIILNSNFNVTISDTSQKKWYQLNGIGAATDIYFETPYKSKIGTKSVLTVNINNLGFIHWLRNNVKYTTDSTLRFDGYHINSILDLKDSTFNKLNSDSTFKKITHARKGEFNINLPTNLILMNKIYFGDMKFSLNTGFRYIFNANYKPYVFVEPAYKINQHFEATYHMGYGGYSKLNFGIALSYQTSQWHFYAGSNNIQGWLFPKIAFGQGFFFMVSKKLK